MPRKQRLPSSSKSHWWRQKSEQRRVEGSSAVLSGSKWSSASEDLPRAISQTTQKCPARRGTEPQGLLTSEGHNPPGWRRSGHHGAVYSSTKPGPVKPWCSLGLGASSRMPLPKGLQAPRPARQLSPQLGQKAPSCSSVAPPPHTDPSLPGATTWPRFSKTYCHLNFLNKDAY